MLSTPMCMYIHLRLLLTYTIGIYATSISSYTYVMNIYYKRPQTHPFINIHIHRSAILPRGFRSELPEGFLLRPSLLLLRYPPLVVALLDHRAKVLHGLCALRHGRALLALLLRARCGCRCGFCCCLRLSESVRHEAGCLELLRRVLRRLCTGGLRCGIPKGQHPQRRPCAGGPNRRLLINKNSFRKPRSVQKHVGLKK